MLKIIQSPTLQSLSKIQHGFFTRHGGVSSGCYASLNCCFAGQDNSENVRENRRRAMAALNKNPDSLSSTINVNGNTVMTVTEPWPEHLRPQADAMVTKLKGIVLGSDSADCPIILLADEHAGVIGLAHAGWRSAKQGIIEATLHKMICLGAKPNQIRAAIGPCIAQNSYEVGPEFFESFIQATPQNKCYFIPAKKTLHHQFNLQAYVNDKLKNAGIQSVSSLNIDTYTNEDFFSCRQSQHKGEPDFGGHLSFITIEE